MRSRSRGILLLMHSCSDCDYRSPKWFGICPACQKGSGIACADEAEKVAFSPLDQINEADYRRLPTSIAELDRVLGGGLVPGSYIVLAGEPGAGKTTLSSQLAISLSRSGKKVAYVSGEESLPQAKLRFERLGGIDSDVLLSDERSVEKICASVKEEGFDLIIVDSIQTVRSSESPSIPGSLSQVRECASQLLEAAKSSNTSVLLVGQVTKDGDMAGPRALEHIVDVVLTFEGDRREQNRILRAAKNRFGSSEEVALFAMSPDGLVEITEPHIAFLDNPSLNLPGQALCCTIEGSRPIICDIQVLAAPSNLPQPVRAARGFDQKRLQMLLAVLSRRAGLATSSMDIYLNISGGLKLDDPGADLAVCAAINSAVSMEPCPDNAVYFGEVSLLGQVRPASQAERRVRECERLGFSPPAQLEALADILTSTPALGV